MAMLSRLVGITAAGCANCGAAVFFDRPRPPREALFSRKGHRIDYRSAGLATLIRSGDGTRGSQWATRFSRNDAATGLRWASMAQPPIQRWRQRRRRQRIFGVLIVIVLVAALLYGWLGVLGKL
jgi:hypothetical protein